MDTKNCPIYEQTGDGKGVGRCWFHLEDGKTCTRHGDVSKYVAIYNATGKCTLENDMRKDRGLKVLE